MDPGSNSSHRPKAPVARYANHFAVSFSQWEFIIDFGQSYSEDGKTELLTRIITRPAYAKDLLEILRESLTRYATCYEDDG